MATLAANYPTNWSGTADDSQNAGATWDKLGQTFKTYSSGPYYLSQIEVGICGVNVYYPGGIVTAEIYAVDGSGYPTGGILSSGSIDISGVSIVSPPKAFSSVAMTIDMAVVELQESTTYVLVLSTTAGCGIKWFATNTSGYSNGKPIQHVSGGSWEDSSSVGDFGFRIWSEIPSLEKPSNPTPADASGPGIDFSDWMFSWEGDAFTETYTVRAGLSPASMSVISQSQASTTLEVPSAYRSALSGGVIYWRVDAEATGYDTTEGDVWSFDPRAAKPTNPTPTHEEVNVSIGLALLDWEGDTVADTYDVYFGTDPEDLALLASEIAATQLAIAGPFAYGTTYYWRVDAVNEYGTTDGDQWEFTTLLFDPPLPSWELLPGKTLGPLDFGIEGIDFRWLGNNFGTTVKRLVVAANNRIYYEDV